MILREVMEEIERQTHASETPRPCEYFDLIGGTSTGGLIAIMLGLLGMVTLSSNEANKQTVGECIEAYLKLLRDVFNVDNVLLGKIPVGDDQCRFDHKVLENSIKGIIKDRLGSEDCEMSRVFTASYHVCPTFVVAKKAVVTDGPPTMFRSYSGEGAGPSKCAIWQAARATSAAPSFFKEIVIANPPPGVVYVDGGLLYNNPSELALEEAKRIWPARRHFCLVSIGTGRQRAVRVIDTSSDDIKTHNSFFDHIKSFIPNIVSFVPGGKIAKNFPRSSRSHQDGEGSSGSHNEFRERASTTLRH